MTASPLLRVVCNKLKTLNRELRRTVFVFVYGISGDLITAKMSEYCCLQVPSCFISVKLLDL